MDIEYLEEYDYMVLPTIQSENQPGQPKNPKDSDDEDSSSIDQDIFETIFDDQSDDEDEVVPTSKLETKTSLQRREDRLSIDSLDLLVEDLGSTAIPESAANSTSLIYKKSEPKSYPMKSTVQTVGKTNLKTTRMPVKKLKPIYEPVLKKPSPPILRNQAGPKIATPKYGMSDQKLLDSTATVSSASLKKYAKKNDLKNDTKTTAALAKVTHHDKEDEELTSTDDSYDDFSGYDDDVYLDDTDFDSDLSALSDISNSDSNDDQNYKKPSSKESTLEKMQVPEASVAEVSLLTKKNVELFFKQNPADNLKNFIKNTNNKTTCAIGKSNERMKSEDFHEPNKNMKQEKRINCGTYDEIAELQRELNTLIAIDNSSKGKESQSSMVIADSTTLDEKSQNPSKTPLLKSGEIDKKMSGKLPQRVSYNTNTELIATREKHVASELPTKRIVMFSNTGVTDKRSNNKNECNNKEENSNKGCDLKKPSTPDMHKDNKSTLNNDTMIAHKQNQNSSNIPVGKFESTFSECKERNLELTHKKMPIGNSRKNTSSKILPSPEVEQSPEIKPEKEFEIKKFESSKVKKNIEQRSLPLNHKKLKDFSSMKDDSKSASEKRTEKIPSKAITSSADIKLPTIQPFLNAACKDFDIGKCKIPKKMIRVQVDEEDEYPITSKNIVLKEGNSTTSATPTEKNRSQIITCNKKSHDQAQIDKIDSKNLSPPTHSKGNMTQTILQTETKMTANIQKLEKIHDNSPCKKKKESLMKPESGEELKSSIDNNRKLQEITSSSLGEDGGNGKTELNENIDRDERVNEVLPTSEIQNIESTVVQNDTAVDPKHALEKKTATEITKPGPMPKRKVTRITVKKSIKESKDEELIISGSDLGVPAKRKLAQKISLSKDNENVNKVQERKRVQHGGTKLVTDKLRKSPRLIIAQIHTNIDKDESSLEDQKSLENGTKPNTPVVTYENKRKQRSPSVRREPLKTLKTALIAQKYKAFSKKDSVSWKKMLIKASTNENAEAFKGKWFNARVMLNRNEVSNYFKKQNAADLRLTTELKKQVPINCSEPLQPLEATTFVKSPEKQAKKQTFVVSPPKLPMTTGPAQVFTIPPQHRRAPMALALTDINNSIEDNRLISRSVLQEPTEISVQQTELPVTVLTPIRKSLRPHKRKLVSPSSTIDAYEDEETNNTQKRTRYQHKKDIQTVSQPQSTDSYISTARANIVTPNTSTIKINSVDSQVMDYSRFYTFHNTYKTQSTLLDELNYTLASSKDIPDENQNRLTAKVLELPAFISMNTKLITRSKLNDKNMPEKLRKHFAMHNTHENLSPSLILKTATRGVCGSENRNTMEPPVEMSAETNLMRQTMKKCTLLLHDFMCSHSKLPIMQQRGAMEKLIRLPDVNSADITCFHNLLEKYVKVLKTHAQLEQPNIPARNLNSIADNILDSNSIQCSMATAGISVHPVNNTLPMKRPESGSRSNNEISGSPAIENIHEASMKDKSHQPNENEGKSSTVVERVVLYTSDSSFNNLQANVEESILPDYQASKKVINIKNEQTADDEIISD